MVVETDRIEGEPRHERAPALSHVQALAEAGAALADSGQVGDALSRIVGAAASAVNASVAVGRVLDDELLVARAVVSESAAVAALLEGSSVPARSAERGGELTLALESAAAAAGATAVLAVPARAGGALVGSLELMRAGGGFSDAEHEFAQAVAAHVAAAACTLDRRLRGARATLGGEEALELAGEALAAGAHEAGAAEEVVRLAVRTTSALASVLWGRTADRELQALVSHGPASVLASRDARTLARRAIDGLAPVQVDALRDGGAAPVTVVTLPLGTPAEWALQLVHAIEPTEDELARLSIFGVRGLHALRAAKRGRTLELELERTRALLTVAAEANEQLSLSHTLETVVEHVSELLGAEQLAVYLAEEGGLMPAAGRALSGPHTVVAERLLELGLGPFRGRGVLVIEDASTDPGLVGLEDELAETGIEAAVAVPLVVREEVTGLLAVYPERGRAPSANDVALVGALAAQLAVSVQNARLHEQSTQLGVELEDVLLLERQGARQLRALYEISRSFAQSLSLETTLDAVVRTVVDLLDVDAAVIRMPDARGELLVPRQLHVADVRLEEPVRAILDRPQPLEKLPGRRHFRRGRALVLDAASAARLGPVHEVLVPFLEKGSTAVELPIATPTELLGTLSLLSLDPDRPIDGPTTELALSLAAQAALAIDNARLYQHQKEFADTMQRSLLPRAQPEVPRIEVGDVYESSARLEVGGDIYDFLTLDDGRLAVVLGDVTGHGIGAAADMAMAKFVFRSLAREHSEPGDFLAAANEVVCDEIGPGKFITMLFLTVDGATGEVACASAGHPRPRLVLPDGSVRGLDVGGIALGVDPGQTYEEAREQLPVGAALIVYTDGVTEARHDGELYGTDRLDLVVSERRESSAKEIALGVLADCRAHSRGELVDDVALVVIKRTAG
jgi:serine phosphatase RsbU (regulator of sigma subunit)